MGSRLYTMKETARMLETIKHEKTVAKEKGMMWFEQSSSRDLHTISRLPSLQLALYILLVPALSYITMSSTNAIDKCTTQTIATELYAFLCNFKFILIS